MRLIQSEEEQPDKPLVSKARISIPTLGRPKPVKLKRT